MQYLIVDVEDHNPQSRYVGMVGSSSAWGWTSREQATRFTLADGVVKMLTVADKFGGRTALEPAP